ncbi:MAG: TIGR01777 family oxidoreductase [Thermodesulfovibrionales bacterium]|nr:TIGR01777 family oxidoreductase [Thermodesulfovibrionales bacterium]
MNIAMTGASGFVGGNLTKAFNEKGWSVTPIHKGDIEIGVERLKALLTNTDVVINLAGAPIIAKWTEQYKKVLYDSRIGTTRKLIDALKQIEKRPDVLISTSAVGIYSEEGSHTESNFTYANDFLGDLARQWEDEALKARQLSIRTVIFRFGIVLGTNGGALQQMITPFKLGLGGTIGDGNQGFSWIHIQDLINAFIKAIEDTSMEGIYNLTAPEPTTNKILTKTLSRALGRPAFFRIPEFVLRLKYGDGARVLTSGQTVFPERLLQGNFRFKFPDITSAIGDIIKNIK